MNKFDFGWIDLWKWKFPVWSKKGFYTWLTTIQHLSYREESSATYPDDMAPYNNFMEKSLRSGTFHKNNSLYVRNRFGVMVCADFVRSRHNEA